MLPRFGENESQSAEDHAGESARQLVCAVEGFDGGFETVDELCGGGRRTTLSALYAFRRYARATANKPLWGPRGARGVGETGAFQLRGSLHSDAVIYQRFSRADHTRDVIRDDRLAGHLEAH